jgi:hypothetical protein
MAAEAGDHVAMTARLRGRVLEDPAQLRLLLFRELLRELNRCLDVGELLGVPQRQEEERPLPCGLEGCVVADLDPLERQGQRVRILRECARRAAVDRPRELIEDNAWMPNTRPAAGRRVRKVCCRR